MSTHRESNQDNPHADTTDATRADAVKADAAKADTETAGADVFDPHTGRSFRIGGHQEKLSEEEELLQLDWYLTQHHPAPAHPRTVKEDGGDDAAVRAALEDMDAWAARLPDRITHAAMMMLGAARDHSWPGVKLDPGLRIEEHTHDGYSTTEIIPAGITDQSPVIITAHGGAFVRGGGLSRDMGWLPVMAALGEAAQARVIDVDYPLGLGVDINTQVAAVRDAAVRAAADYPDAPRIGLGTSAGALLIAAASAASTAGDQDGDNIFDAIVLSRPTIATDSPLVAGPAAIDPAALVEQFGPDRLLVLSGTHDTTVPHVAEFEPVTQWFMAKHLVCTPEVARTRVQAAADFIAQQTRR